MNANRILRIVWIAAATFLIGHSTAIADRAMFRSSDIRMGWGKSVAWQHARSDFASIADYDAIEDGHCVFMRYRRQSDNWSTYKLEAARNCGRQVWVRHIVKANRYQLCQTGTWRCSTWRWF